MSFSPILFQNIKYDIIIHKYRNSALAYIIRQEPIPHITDCTGRRGCSIMESISGKFTYNQGDAI